MPTTYSRDAIQFEADFASHFFGLTPEKALAHEAVYFHHLQRASYKHNFDNTETDAWLKQYLPAGIEERQRIRDEAKEFYRQIHEDEMSYNHYSYEYAQFCVQRSLDNEE